MNVDGLMESLKLYLNLCSRKWIRPSKTAIYKTRNIGTGNGMRGMRGTRGMFTKIPGNLLEDSGECGRRFRGMFQKIPGNVREDSGKSKFRFILWNLAYLLSNSAIKLRKNKWIFSSLLITTLTNLLRLNAVFHPPFFFSISFSCRGNGLITVHSCRSIKKL